MKIDPKHKITRVVSKDPTRENIQHPYLDTKGPRPMLWATNGAAAVCVPVETDPADVEGRVPRLAVDRATRGRVPREVRIRPGGVTEVVRVERTVRLSDGPEKFPDPASIPAQIPTPDTQICLDARVLLDVARALGAERDQAIVVIEFRRAAMMEGDYGAPMRVRVEESPDALGYLMPCRIPREMRIVAEPPPAATAASQPDDAVPLPTDPAPPPPTRAA